MPEHSCWLVIRGRDIGLFSDHLVLKSLLKQNTIFGGGGRGGKDFIVLVQGL